MPFHATLIFGSEQRHYAYVRGRDGDEEGGGGGGGVNQPVCSAGPP